MPYKTFDTEYRPDDKPSPATACRADGRCQYAIDHGAEGLGHCPVGECAQPSDPADIYEEEYTTQSSVGGTHEHSHRAALAAVVAAFSAPSATAPLQWRKGVPPHPWDKEWFIAETTFGDRVVLTALPKEHTYDFKTADDTYIKANKIVRWMQFPDSTFITSDESAVTETRLGVVPDQALPCESHGRSYLINLDGGITCAKCLADFCWFGKTNAAKPTETESQYCPKCGGTKGHWEGCTAPNIPSAPAEADGPHGGGKDG